MICYQHHQSQQKSTRKKNIEEAVLAWEGIFSRVLVEIFSGGTVDNDDENPKHM